MSAPATAAVRATLWCVGGSEDVPLLEGRSVAVAGRRLAVFNTGQGFVAVDAECPHRGGPLSDGLVADGCVTCPLHDWRIDLTSGEVVAGGEGSVRRYEVIEHDGELLVRVDAAEGDAG